MRRERIASPPPDTGPPAEPVGAHDDGDLTEILNELRILLPGAQLLTAFLITLPFNSGFRQIVTAEKWVFMATFIFFAHEHHPLYGSCRAASHASTAG